MKTMQKGPVTATNAEPSEGCPGSFAKAGSTPFHLTAEQIDSFDQNGFLILRKLITGELLERAQQAGDLWIRQALEIQGKGQAAMESNPDYLFAKRQQKTVFSSVGYLHSKGSEVSLELLGSPQVLAVAESLCGSNFVPTYESMVVKMEGDGQIIPWHQDAVFPRKFRVFNFDLYLDASTRDGGALRVFPGTQRQVHDVCKVAETHAWDDPRIMTVEMEPGDVLLHDDMVLHGSPHVEGKARRRTIYFEFRPIEQILEEGPWDYSFIEKRMRLLPLAMGHYQARYPQGPQFSWNCSNEHRPVDRGSNEEELRIVHLVHSKSSYCSAGGSLKLIE